jgi:hypothetical protein
MIKNGLSFVVSIFANGNWRRMTSRNFLKFSRFCCLFPGDFAQSDKTADFDIQRESSTSKKQAAAYFFQDRECKERNSFFIQTEQRDKIFDVCSSPQKTSVLKYVH